jgi:hypothetical protein
VAKTPFDVGLRATLEYYENNQKEIETR